MLNREALSEVLVAILLREGPQDFRSLCFHLQGDSEFGYLAFQIPNIDQQIRDCLNHYSNGNSPKFLMSFEYKWQVLQSSSYVSELNLSINQSSPWLQIGKGQTSVYGIFSRKLMSERRTFGSNWYPIKIGRTSRNIADRLRELQTGSYFDLQLGIQIKTDNSVELEGYLHSRLSHRKVCSEATQNEWYFSSIEEIESIYSHAMGTNHASCYQNVS